VKKKNKGIILKNNKQSHQFIQAAAEQIKKIKT
jgi:hypothetical protein